MARITGFHRIRSKRSGFADFWRKRNSILLQETNKRFEIVNEGKLYMLEEKNSFQSLLGCLLGMEAGLLREHILTLPSDMR